ncbi:RNA polymerase sigma factor [Spirosoma linguale]|uniref:RNA polymerase, sigma-24 subunit, ECF subfamily n=1 Tax=Spirosoma linguale (strain ATCC 33905 / DSM 74 / LMG 10896 / Claus 1) TaxID=504472 RepID=D2QDE1_SPILD|nr:RNA polymerase, sigma-24 subunit, ECF subfamily [Spirosoma linguale DSM 74]
MKKQTVPNSPVTTETDHLSICNLESFEILYSNYASKIHQKCLTMINDDETAKDFTQDIFLKVFTKLHTFQNRASFATWIYAIAHNYCLDQIRISKRFSRESLSDDLIGELPESDNQETEVARLHVLELLMKELPIHEVTMLRLKHEQGLSVKAISERYQLSESAVKMRLKRTRDKIQSLLDNQCYA